MQANMGMAGEFRVVVKRADSSTKIDTGYQKNLILNQGLDFFGGGNGSDMMTYCVIGSGNSQPIYTQNKLDTALAGINGSDVSTKYDYDAARDGSLYKTNRVCKYSFSGLNNVNVSELGLASIYDSTTTYFLCTRALIKDSQGKPTTITVLAGEVLEVYYKLWQVLDVTDKTGQINLLDGAGGSIGYSYKIRLALVGPIYSSYAAGYNVGGWFDAFASDGPYKAYYANTGDLAAITSQPSGEISRPRNYTLGNYVIGDYKRTMKINATIAQANGNVRAIVIFTTFGVYQIRFGSVADDSPINKTSTQTLTIPIEFSWGRYEGAL